MNSYTPKQDQKIAYILSVLCMVPGVIAFLIAPMFRNLFALQLIAIGCCSAGLYLMYRYALIHFIYTVDEHNLLTVTRVSGKRSNAVARIALSDCDMLVRAEDPSLKGMRFPAGRYTYHVTFAAQNRYVLAFKDADRRACLILEGDPAFASDLSRKLPPDATVRI